MRSLLKSLKEFVDDYIMSLYRVVTVIGLQWLWLKQSAASVKHFGKISQIGLRHRTVLKDALKFIFKRLYIIYINNI